MCPCSQIWEVSAESHFQPSQILIIWSCLKLLGLLSFILHASFSTTLFLVSNMCIKIYDRMQPKWSRAWSRKIQIPSTSMSLQYQRNPGDVICFIISSHLQLYLLWLYLSFFFFFSFGGLSSCASFVSNRCSARKFDLEKANFYLEAEFLLRFTVFFPFLN